MTVFKAFLKILNKNKFIIIIYTILFDWLWWFQYANK